MNVRVAVAAAVLAVVTGAGRLAAQQPETPQALYNRSCAACHGATGVPAPAMASRMGIPVDRIITITFAIGSALAAAAGVLVGLTNPKIDPLMGIMPGVKAFVAAVLGGIGSVPGAVIGGLLMGISEYMVVGYISSTYRDAIAFVILILVLLLRPAGLLGRNVAEKV